MSTHRRKPIINDVAVDVLLDEIPSDYEYGTDQESESEDEGSSMDPLSKALDEETVEYDSIQQHEKSRCVIIVNPSDLQNTSVATQHQINEIEDETFSK